MDTYLILCIVVCYICWNLWFSDNSSTIALFKIAGTLSLCWLPYIIYSTINTTYGVKFQRPQLIIYSNYYKMISNYNRLITAQTNV